MLNRVLSNLRKYNNFINIKNFSNVTNISENEIIKSLEFLRNMDYNIIENDKEEIMLIQDDEDRFNYLELSSFLKTNFIGKNIHFFDEIDSTNTFAKKFADENTNSEGDIFVTKKQTNGKGRLGRKWIDSQNKNIAVSLILKPKIFVSDITKINLIISISICDAIKRFTGLSPKIKWPNDIIINNKKICGILIETSSEKNLVKHVIIGIGLNVNSDEMPEEIRKKATSLKIELGKTLSRAALLSEILFEIENNYNNYECCFEDLIEKYINLCLNIGKEVKATIQNKEIEGRITGVNFKGELILSTNFYEEIYLSTGEVFLKNLDGRYI